MDVDHLKAIRRNVDRFLANAAETYGQEGGKLLDIAPQVWAGAKAFFPPKVQVETLDIDPESGADHIGDITKFNERIAAESFEFVVCTEVLEHTLNPFDAVAEMRRMLKPGGLLFLSVPFNFRIHGPLPDCWRFTEHGLRALLSSFSLVDLDWIDAEDRPLMPVHYTAIAKKC